MRMTLGSALALAGVAALLLGTTPNVEPARASVPTGTPTFSNPTDFDNAYFPFEVGAVKIYVGRSDGERTAVADLYMTGTRDFAWNGGTVTCSILQETEFEGGELIEISTNYFAQADDGSVYYFGETVDEFEDGEIVSHGGSWLVGGAGQDDPVGTLPVTQPALFMPGDPEQGDVFRPEDVPNGPTEEATIEKDDKRVRVPAGRYEECLQVREHDLLDDEIGRKWYAPGVGPIKAKGKGEVLKLIASSLLGDD